MCRMALLLIVVLVTTSAPAVPDAETAPATRPATPQPRQRAARALAAVVLAEQIQALPLAGATVGDLLAEKPQAQWMLLLALRDRPLAEPPAHAADGAGRLKMQLAMPELVDILGRIAAATGLQAKAADLAGLTDRPALTVSVTAKGNPALDLTDIPTRPGPEYFGRAPENVQAFWNANVTPAGRADAEKRARDSALAGLAERIKVVRVDETATLADYVAAVQADADLRQFVRAARPRAMRYHVDAPIVEVDMTVSLRTIYACLKAWAHIHRPAGAELLKLEGLVVAAEDAEIRQTGLGWPEPGQLTGTDPKLSKAIAIAQSAPDWAGRSLSETVDAVGDDNATRWRARASLAARAAQLPELTKALALAPKKTLPRTPGDRAALLAALRFTTTPVDEKPTRIRLPLTALWRLLLAKQLAEEPTTRPAAD